ncbi:MAG TPA: D-alanyl-D-alanine carboxypeptidase/D-alanyl-D-alanine-endopeptidase [Propionibacteriaceae bacterium]|nr:D-alanyl-D-alanine carboxypeptidase/D-alanyl-D-alanine-endopeptidase [Propionibacteriaceae bacterium]
MPRRAWGSLALSMVLVLAVAAGVWFAGPRILYATGLWTDGGSPTIDPSLYAPTPLPTPTPVTPTPVAATASQGRLPDGPALLTKLDAVDRSSVPTDGFAVLDPFTGAVVTGENADTLLIPASTFKVLTSAAVLQAYGPDHRFTTKVVAGSGNQIVLVGGGDPYLSGAGNASYPQRASIADLAEATVKSLASSGQTSVSLAYDDSLFSGDAWNPAWEQGYHEFATPTSALWVDEDVVGGVHRTTPSLDAANAFAAQLRARGIQVTAVAAGTAPSGAATLASVQSLPLDLIISQVLLHSDNDGAEVLFRHLALADGGAGTIAAGQAALRSRLVSLGLWRDGMVVDDGSGLSRANRAPSTVLALAVAKGFTDPRYRALVDGLPTAAADGTLYARYDDAPEVAGRGAVRAKTGTLTGVHSLAGFTRTADGGLVVFAFITNDVAPEQALAARDWLERTTSVVAACGC